MASTSSTSTSISTFIPQWKYDVFLSFRGEDTRFNFTDHLYANLIRRVFSENYAGSRWCLDELVKIMKCRKEMKQTVVPIFYHVDPSHVRHQTGRFGEAFSNHKEDTKEMKEKVRSWRSALTEAANISGVHVKDGYESEHIKKIVNNIFMRLNCRMFDVGANLVGMDSHVNEIIRQLCLDQLNDALKVLGSFLIDKTILQWESQLRKLEREPQVEIHNVLKGMKNVEAIFLDLSRSTPLQQLKVILPEDFEFPAHELRYLHWEGYPLKSLPSNFLGVNLIELNMKDSNIKQLRQRNERLEQLKILNLSGSRQLTEISSQESYLVEFAWVQTLTSLPSSIQYLDSLEDMDLSLCSNLEEFPEMKGSPMKALSFLHLVTARCSRHSRASIESARNRCPPLHEAGNVSSPSSLLWSSLLKWFNPTSNEHLNCKEGKMILIVGNGGIPGWVLHQEIGSQVRIEPPLNWYEDDHFLGFAFFTLYQNYCPSRFSLRLRGDPGEVVDYRNIWHWCSCDKWNGDASDRLWHNFGVARINIKRCGVQLIYTHDYLHDNVPMLLIIKKTMMMPGKTKQMIRNHTLKD
ncbi:TMV resistance protein N [Vitis vinifera]|uniref:TMV resistance protein N n=1 Tax=Vitis vinifera TaxID=29760 RepID=A0A438BM27_VITVI|nr:TMV resistance protein N [Vitis vinifera]